MKDQFDENLDRISKLENVILNIERLVASDDPWALKLFVKDAVSFYEIKDQPLSTTLGDFLLSSELEKEGKENA